MIKPKVFHPEIPTVIKYIYEEITMKKLTILLSIFLLAAIGCSKPESKLAGKWKSPTMQGFVAEFSKDHTGTTATPVPGHAGAMESAVRPFTWTVSKDGKIKITEDKTEFFGKLVGKKLELEINGAIVVLDKAK
jgi:hypothetical protein